MQNHAHSKDQYGSGADFGLPGRRLRELPLETSRLLCEEAPIRPATSVGEARAAAFLGGRLRRAGFRVSTDTFLTREYCSWDSLALAGSALLTSVVFWWVPWLAIAVAGLTLAIAFLGATDLGLPWLSHRRASQNVIGTYAANDMLRQRVLLCVALDSRVPWWHPLAAIKPIILDGIRIILATFLLLLILLHTLAGIHSPPALVGVLVGALAVLAMFDLILRFVWHQPGHLREAGALAVLMAACEGLVDLVHTELWAVGIGATSSGAGVRNLLARYPFSPTTIVIRLAVLGSGEPAYRLAAEAREPVTHYAAQLAARDDIQLDRMRAPGHATPFLQEHVLIGCLGHGKLPDDQYGPALERTTRFVEALVRMIDQAP